MKYSNEYNFNGFTDKGFQQKESFDGTCDEFARAKAIDRKEKLILACSLIALGVCATLCFKAASKQIAETAVKTAIKSII